MYNCKSPRPNDASVIVLKDWPWENHELLNSEEIIEYNGKQYRLFKNRTRKEQVRFYTVVRKELSKGKPKNYKPKTAGKLCFSR